MSRDRALALVSEIADVLASHGRLRCVPTIAKEGGRWTLSVTFDSDAAYDGLETLSLADELQYVIDVAQLRGFAAYYDIDAADIEAIVTRVRYGH